MTPKTLVYRVCVVGLALGLAAGLSMPHRPALGVGNGEPAHRLREFFIAPQPQDGIPLIGHEIVGS